MIDVVSPGTHREAFGAIEALPKSEPPPLPTTRPPGAPIFGTMSWPPCVPMVDEAATTISPRKIAAAFAAVTPKIFTDALRGSPCAGTEGNKPE